MSETVPIAECRLELPGLLTQRDRYRRLGATATRVERHGDALIVVFGPALDEDLLEETLALERDCCPFFGLDYERAARSLTVTVADPQQQPALDGLYFAVTGSEPASPVAHQPPRRGVTRPPAPSSTASCTR